MKKRLIFIIMCMMLGVMLIACGKEEKDSAGSEGNEGGKEQEETVDKDFSIAMTEDYTFTDPEDIEFDSRIVMVGDENSKLLSDMANMGYMATNIYDIMYIKDGKATGEYQYFVAADEENAKALADFYSSQGQKIVLEGRVLYSFQDGDQVQATITMFASMGNMSEETPEAYMEMMKDFNGLLEYN